MTTAPAWGIGIYMYMYASMHHLPLRLLHPGSRDLCMPSGGSIDKGQEEVLVNLIINYS